MNIYYIDYENVTSQGLKGVDALTENDEVVLLYSKKADNVKIEMLTMLMASKAKIRFLPVHVGTPNALDFQLVTLLFLNYKDSDCCYIISKDSGYDCCIKTAAENGAPNVARYPNIESAIKGIPAKKTRRGKRTAQETLSETPAAAKKDTAKDTGKDALPVATATAAVAKGENNTESQTESSQSQKEETAAASAQPAKSKTSQNQKSRSRRQNAKNQTGQNKDAQGMNAQSSAPDQVKPPAENPSMKPEQTNEQTKPQHQNNSHDQKPAQAQDNSRDQKPVQAQDNSRDQKPAQAQDNSRDQKQAQAQDNSRDQKPAQAQDNSKDHIPTHGQNLNENQDRSPEQDKNQVQSQAQSQVQGETPDIDQENTESSKQSSDSSAPEDTQKKKSTRRHGKKKAAASDTESGEHSDNSQLQVQNNLPENKESGDSNKSAPAEHVLQQRYLSKQFEPKGLQADKTKSEAEKPVSILSVIRRRNDVQLDMHQIDLIRSALKESGNKQQFYSYFVKKLGQKQGIELYHSIKSSYTDLVNATLL